MATSVSAGRGLGVHRNVSSWYPANHTPVHELGCRVTSPTPADNESEVSERIESWVGYTMRLKSIVTGEWTAIGPAVLVGVVKDLGGENQLTG